MRLKKTIKQTIYIFSILALLLSNISHCYAGALPSINNSLMDNQGDGSGGSGEEEPPHKDYDEGHGYSQSGKYYVWSYDYQINVSTNFTGNAYDIDGDSVMHDRTNIDTSKYNYISGTWLGINVTKTSITTWEISNIEYKEAKKRYTCKYSKPSPYDCSYTVDYVTEAYCSNLGGSFTPLEKGRGTCKIKKTCYSGTEETETQEDVGYYDTYDCSTEYGDYRLVKEESETIYEDFDNNSLKNQLKQKAIDEVYNQAKNMGAGNAGKVTYTKDDGEESGVINDGKIVRNEDFGITQTRSGANGKIIREYEFLEEYVCINVKTGKVTYASECENQLSSEEIMRISNATIRDPYLNKNVKYWHYFVPLNAKSDYKQTIRVEEQDGAQSYSTNSCLKFMEEEDEYEKYIIAKDGSNLIGDYNKQSASQDIKKINTTGGCRLATVVEFPVTQEFYREVKDEDDNIKFNGFNFYYKPIDINNMFPNGLAANSLWTEWNETSNKKPDISKSFNNVTYSTKINAGEIRNYTKNNPYTSWDNMDTTGISRFIEDYSIINRSNDQTIKSNIYKLACGPYNESWGGCK